MGAGKAGGHVIRVLRVGSLNNANTQLETRLPVYRLARGKRGDCFVPRAVSCSRRQVQPGFLSLCSGPTCVPADPPTRLPTNRPPAYPPTSPGYPRNCVK